MQLVKDSFTDQIYQIVKEKILLTELRMGEQLNPRALAEEFHVSAMPVREALHRLINEGLAVNRSRVGFFVRSFTPEEIAHIMEMRQLFELYCLETYFDRIDPLEVKAFLKRCQGRTHLSRREFDQLDEGIHDLIVNASQNPLLMKSYHEVKNQIIICRHLDRDRIEVAHGEHIQLLQAIIAPDRPKAVQVLRGHIKRVADSIAVQDHQGDAGAAEPGYGQPLRARP